MTLEPNAVLPAVTLPRTDGSSVELAAPGWHAIVIYRGAHCPMCQAFLTGIKGVLTAYREAGIKLTIASADTAAKAGALADQTGLTLAYGLSVPQMRALGLFVSVPLEGEADAPFAEPALLVVNPTGRLQVLMAGNAPFVRPDLATVLEGLKYIQGNGYPVRGTHGLAE